MTAFRSLRPHTPQPRRATKSSPGREPWVISAHVTISPVGATDSPRLPRNNNAQPLSPQSTPGERSRPRAIPANGGLNRSHESSFVPFVPFVVHSPPSHAHL